MRSNVARVMSGWMVVLGLLPAVAAAQLPPVNLGFTSFLDGGPPAGPGFYFQEYVQYYTAGVFKDQDGNRAPLIDDLNVWVSLNQFILQSDQEVLPGAKWGLDVIVPLVSLEVDRGPAPVLNSNHQGLGDILVGPYLQWDPIMGDNGPILIHRVELQNLLPTGKYDNDKVLNPSSNFYSFNPYWAGTWFAAPHCEVTWRLHYLWNGENADPNKSLYGSADETQAGQAAHINFASSYEVLPKQLRVGFNGYYLRQFTNNEVDGKGIPDSREQVLGIGPGAIFSFSQDDHIFFNTYFESQAENRAEGMRFNLRWTHHF